MDLLKFRETFATDQALIILSDEVISLALDEANAITSVSEFGALKERAAGLYAAHILTIESNAKNGIMVNDASSMSFAGQSVTYSRTNEQSFYSASIYGQRYLALKNSIPTTSGQNPNALTADGQYIF